MQILRTHGLLLALLICTLAAYAPSIGNDFVNLDDTLLVTENIHVTRASIENIIYVFTHFDPELYIPLTFLTYQLETWTLGLHAWHFHAINLLLHLGSIVLVYTIVRQLTKSQSVTMVAAALFALHPVHSEAVFWISGRKDLLSGFFALAALAGYLKHQQKKSSGWYVATILLTLAALLSKVSAVTLPLLFLLIDNVEKEQIKKSIVKLSPFFVLACLFGTIAMLGKSHIEKNMMDLLLMAFRSTGFALQMFMLPTNLSVVHSIDTIGLWEPGFIPSIIAAVVLTALTFSVRRQLPMVWFGWAFFLITLAPSIAQYEHGNGVLYAGSERYLYLPVVGLSLAVASLFLSSGLLANSNKRNRTLLLVIGIVLCLNFSGIIFLRSSVWKNSETLNRSIVQKEPNDPIAHHNLGIALKDQNRWEEAEAHFRNAIQEKPTLFDAHSALGSLLIEQGKSEEGLAHLLEATKLRPDAARGFFNLGVAYQKLMRWEEAEQAYKQVIVMAPTYAESYRNLALVYGKMGKYQEAIQAYSTLAELDPSFADTLQTAIENMKK